MNHKTTPILLASLTAATLGLSQAALATDPAAAMPPPPAPMAAIESPDAVIARMEERHRQMAAERERRYEELRRHASELGFEMPAMPPWEPSERAGMPAPDFAPWITPEEREALREKRWQETRTRAAERGVELPETPPWKAAAERRQAMKERFERFRATMDALSEEQREAIEGLIGPVPEFGEIPDAGNAPPRPAGMGPGMHHPGHGWHGHRCPHHWGHCNQRTQDAPGGGAEMMAPPALDPSADLAPDAGAQ